MKVIVLASLAGGQGKTSTSLNLGLYLASQGKRVLFVDADPQASLTLFLGHTLESGDATLLEVLKQQCGPENAIYQTGNAYLIPADEALREASSFLAAQCNPAQVLHQAVIDQLPDDLFDYTIIDCPPSHSQLVLSAIGAGDYVIIPAEPDPKGLNALAETSDLINEMKRSRVFFGSILGAIPFRDRWRGRSRTIQAQEVIEAMEAIASDYQFKLFPPIRDLEGFRKAMDRRSLPEGDLLFPFESIAANLIN